MAHKINSEGLALIKASEGLRLNAYYDSVGVLTIGYGTTNACKDVTGVTITPSLTISKATAEKWLEDTINKKYMPKVDKYDSKYHWTDNEASALCSFAYNIGNIDGLTSNGTRSRATIAEKFLAYNKAGGKVLAGLTTRRNKEKTLFLKGSVPEAKSDGIAIATIKEAYAGKNVLCLQKNINELTGWKIPETSSADKLTISALIMWQFLNGLDADGIYGAKSEAKMREKLKEK